MPVLNFLTPVRTRINIARLMPPEPLSFIHPLRLIKQAAVLEGRIEINELGRLRAAILDTEGELDYRLEFGVDPANQARITGQVAAPLHMRCQRCMQPMPVYLQAAVSLGVIEAESQAESLPEHYEPLVVGNEPLRLADLLEDEALLALPFAPLHAPSECSVKPDTGVTEPVAEAPTHRPFAGLADLKRNKE